MALELVNEDMTPEAQEAAAKEELLSLVRNNQMLATPVLGTQATNRQDAIYYYEGRLHEVADDWDQVPRYDGRSSVVSLKLAEQIETMIPVIMDIVTDKETIAFRRRRGEPAEVAQRETDAVFSIIYEENDGWQVVHDAIWDAAIGRFGVAVVGNEETPDGERKVTVESVDPDRVRYVATSESVDKSPYWSVDYSVTNSDFEERYGLAPQDFAPLPTTNTQQDVINQNGGLISNMDTVGLTQHYIRQGKEYLCITTDYAVTTVFDVEVHDCLNVIWFTIYKRPHSLVGDSVYDRVKGPQKVETTLMRLAMDQAQFSQTNRPVINRNAILPETVDQLATDAPGVPVLVNGPPDAAIRPLYTSTALPFDVFGFIEWNNADAEGRAGVGRQMQGVNGEALHETARVGMQMENRQQMRVRTVARHIAEGPMRKLYEAVHCMARAVGALVEMPVAKPEPDMPDTEMIDAGGWQPLRGVTAIVDVKGGSDALQMQAMAVKETVTELVAAQGGAPDGPFINQQNILNAAKFNLSAAGLSDPGDFIPDEPYQPDGPPAPPPPDPELVKAQAQIAQGEQKIQIEAMSKQADAEIRAQQMQMDAQKQNDDAEFKRWQIQQELALKREIAAEELALKRYQIDLNAQLQREKAASAESVDTDTGSAVHVGGDPG